MSGETRGLPHEYAQYTSNKDIQRMQEVEDKVRGENEIGDQFVIGDKTYEVGDYGTYVTKEGKEIKNLELLGKTPDGQGIILMESQGTNSFNVTGESLERWTKTANYNTEQEKQVAAERAALKQREEQDMENVRNKIDSIAA